MPRAATRRAGAYANLIDVETGPEMSPGKIPVWSRCAASQ